MKLKNGYYWISYSGMEPRISRWDGMFWNGEHDEGPEGILRSENVRVLSNQAIEPTAEVLRSAENSETDRLAKVIIDEIRQMAIDDGGMFITQKQPFDIHVDSGLDVRRLSEAVLLFLRAP